MPSSEPIENIKVLNELVADGSKVNDYLMDNKLFDETMINVDPSLLSNLLITFDIDTIKHYFEDDAWLLVLDVVKKKLTSILCKICNNSCLLSYAECEICKFFYHFECERISTYFRNKIKDGHKSWKCSSCKGSKQNKIAD